MKTLLKIVGGLVGLLVVLVLGGITYVTQALPSIPVRGGLKVEATPERIARGEYLANHVTLCMDCHSTRDWSLYSGPLVPGTLGKGGELFDESMGFPGKFISRNITPFNLSSWSDAELHRVITTGVNKSNKPMFPVMPYLNYGKMDDEDVFSIIAYVRSLSPQDSTPPPSEPIFPVSVIMHTMPQPATPTKRPDPSDTVAYGAYVANAAACVECHTKQEQGQKVGPPFAGGFEFKFPTGAIVRSANITPSDTGIGKWSREQFITRFKGHDPSTYTPPKVDMSKGEFQTVMPWMMYAGMTEEDLGAIYDYLKTVPPVEGQVLKWTPAP